MPAMKATIEALQKAGVRDQVKVMVGGAPVTESYAKEIGADGYSQNAAGAVGVARDL
jgi:5-methyltetrahydrofolate--homocysteine methyltransferase